MRVPTVPTTSTVFDGLVFPEGPRWHAGHLWFSDIHGRRVWRIAPDGAAQVVAPVALPSGLGFLPDGDVLVVGMHAKVVWRVTVGNRLELHADLGRYPGEFLNDMVVDSSGIAYVGCRTHRKPGAAPTQDVLVRVLPDGSTDIAAADVIGPNGAAITPDGSTLILAETHAHRITAFDRGPSGELSGRRVFAELDRSLLDGRKVFPDGLCLDADGAVWVATGFGGVCLRVRQGGEVTDRVAPADGGRWAIACVLGGVDRRTLYVATAALELENLRRLDESHIVDDDDHRAWAAALSRGSIEAVDVSVPGAGTP